MQVPRTNDAGLRSAIRFFLVPVAKTQETFDISCLHTRLSCAGTVTVSEAHPTVPADANIAAHEQMLAEAEDIRRRGNETSWPVALEKFRTAAEFFQASGDGARRRAARNGEARLLLYRLSDYRAAHNAAVDSILVDTGEADLQGQGLAWKTLSSVEAAVWTGLGDLYTQLNDDTRAEESYQKALPLCLPMSNAWRERMPPFCCRVKPEPPRN